jgi:pimeloyl-ACP methyl ester carboxylesterase
MPRRKYSTVYQCIRSTQNRQGTMQLQTLFCYLSYLVMGALAMQAWDDWGHKRIQLQDTSIHFRYSQGGKPPLLLIHGSPQHSRTWIHMGPILAEQFTMIAPDNRGQGDSALSTSDNYTADAAATDHLAILNFLNISKTYVLAHDKGVGIAASLAFEHPERIEKAIFAEYPLPGFGYPTSVTSPDPYQNWQLAFFAVPDVAQFFIQGKEKQMLEWYFWHSSYSGTDVISNESLDVYARAISKPGFLRAMFQYFAAAFQDETYFNSTLASKGKLQMPVLAMGGEASFSPASVLQQAFSSLASNLETAVVPQAGHWIVSNADPAKMSPVTQLTIDYRPMRTQRGWRIERSNSSGTAVCRQRTSRVSLTPSQWAGSSAPACSHLASMALDRTFQSLTVTDDKPVLVSAPNYFYALSFITPIQGRNL